MLEYFKIEFELLNYFSQKEMTTDQERRLDRSFKTEIMRKYTNEKEDYLANRVRWEQLSPFYVPNDLLLSNYPYIWYRKNLDDTKKRFEKLIKRLSKEDPLVEKVEALNGKLNAIKQRLIDVFADQIASEDRSRW